MGTKEAVLANISKEQRKCSFEYPGQLCPVAQDESRRPKHKCIIYHARAEKADPQGLLQICEAFHLSQDQAVNIAAHRMEADPNVPFSGKGCVDRLRSLNPFYQKQVLEDAKR